MITLRAAIAFLFATLVMPAEGKDAAKTETVTSSKTERVTANLGKGCRIAAHILPSRDGGLGGDPNTGRGGIGVNPVPKEWRSRLSSVGFQLTCLDAEEVKDGNNTVSFDPQTNTWTKDVAKRVKAFGFEMSPQEYQRIYAEEDMAIRVYNVTAQNAKGFASTVDDMMGDERKRKKEMRFCLYHPPKALCGIGVVGYLAEGPRSDLTQRALEIIRSIEFLPDQE